MQQISGLIVILGSPNDEQGNLSQIGQGRISLGYQEYNKREKSDWKILLTGGFGAHFNLTTYPHAHYAKLALLEKGVPKSEIVEFAESENSIEDALLARPIVEKHKASKLLVVTSDFHLNRAQYIFAETFPDLELSFSGAEYLSTCSTQEAEHLQFHEERAIEKLRSTSLGK